MECGARRPRSRRDAALERGAEINSGNRYKATALFFAADKGHVEIVKLLLDKGADINTTDTFYRTDDRFTADADSDASSRVLSSGGTVT